MIADIQELQWYVVYTMAKSEKKVASSIDQLGIESYLPLHSVVRQWSDRKKKMKVPLFPNYVFVKANPIIRPHLYSIRELVRFVSIEKRPVVIQEKEILTIRRILSEDDDVVAEDYLQRGMRVKINAGQFAGIEGIIVQKCGRNRLVIKIDGLMKAFSFNLSARHTEVIPLVKPKPADNAVLIMN